MRRFFLVGLAVVGCFLSATAVGASTRSNAPVDDPERAYWLAAHNLTQEQVRLLDRVEQSTQKPELNRLKTLSGQVLLYTSSVDRFLKTNYPDSELLCSPPAGLGEVAGTDGASLEQVRVYCSLYRSTRDLTAMRTRLDQQVRSIAMESKPVRDAEKPAAKVPVNVASGASVSNQAVLILVESSRQRLAQMQAAFPEALRISIVQPTSTVPARSANSR